MKCALVLLCVVAAGLASETPESPVYGYHLKEGIPKANAIRAAEQRAAQDGARIVGGVVTNIADVPYQVGLLMQILWIFQSACGGVLISNTRVLTAAHCKTDGVINAQSFTAIFGSNTIFTGGLRMNMPPSNVIMHPQWNWNNAANDIAVMVLPNSVAFSNFIQPIALPSGPDASNDFIGEQALASGYGANADNAPTNPNQALHSVWLPVVDGSVCANIYNNIINTWFRETNVCVSGEGGQSTCSGDSGGPLVVDRPGGRVLIGLTSFGHIDGCQINMPAAFARVTSFLSWIATI